MIVVVVIFSTVGVIVCFVVIIDIEHMTWLTTAGCRVELAVWHLCIGAGSSGACSVHAHFLLLQQVCEVGQFWLQQTQAGNFLPSHWEGVWPQQSLPQQVGHLDVLTRAWHSSRLSQLPCLFMRTHSCCIASFQHSKLCRSTWCAHVHHHALHQAIWLFFWCTKHNTLSSKRKVGWLVLQEETSSSSANIPAAVALQMLNCIQSGSLNIHRTAYCLWLCLDWVFGLATIDVGTLWPAVHMWLLWCKWPTC